MNQIPVKLTRFLLMTYLKSKFHIFFFFFYQKLILGTLVLYHSDEPNPPKRFIFLIYKSSDILQALHFEFLLLVVQKHMSAILKNQNLALTHR